MSLYSGNMVAGSVTLRLDQEILLPVSEHLQSLTIFTSSEHIFLGESY